MAYAKGMDLIEVSPDANPPVAKITDYGKYQYNLKKHNKDVKARQKVSEVKNIQIKVATGAGSMKMKADKAGEWLNEGHRVKVELFLRGRAKYIDKDFLHAKLYEFVKMIPAPIKIVDDIKGSGAGIAIIVEFDKSGVGAKIPEIDISKLAIDIPAEIAEDTEDTIEETEE